jgi:ABC-type dipeptide/oligopeptide/nickel transport system permease component
MVYLGTLLYVAGLLVTDILYAVLDPRVRLT